MKPYYQDELITIYNDDCLNHLDVLKQADVLISDPPYGYSYKSNMGGKWSGYEIENDHSTEARDMILDSWGYENPAIVFGSYKRERPAFTKNVLIWDKGNSPGMGDLSMPWGHSHEEIYVIGTGFTGKRIGSVLRYQNIQTSDKGKNGRNHPNEKPLDLMRHLIEYSPVGGGVIIDPFMGSGSTLVACQQLGRRCIGFDIEQRWCDVAVSRLSQKPLFTT